MNQPLHGCSVMSFAVGCDELPMRYNGQYVEYLVRYFDGGTSSLLIGVCPFCGATLPPSKRNEWFERVWAMDLEPEDPEVPTEMRSDAWWRGTELDNWKPTSGSALSTGRRRDVSPVRRDISDEMLPHACERMVYAVGEPDLPIAYTAAAGVYAIEYQDTGEKGLMIEFCPFCGAHLPTG